MRTNKVHSGAEEKTFRALYEAYKNRLFGFVLAMVHDRDTAEELIQDIFVTLWINRSKLPEIDHLESYLFAMAKNKTFNYLRKAANDAGLLKKLQARMNAAQNNVEEHMAATEHSRLMTEALNTLSAQRRRVFILSRYEGLNMEEIADRLHLSKNTIKNHLVTALRIIRTYLSDHGMMLPLLYLAIFRPLL